jgi:hypothetical protein
VSVDCGGEIQGSGRVGASSGNAAPLTIDRGNIRCRGSLRTPSGTAAEIDVACDVTGGTCDAILACESGACETAGGSLPGDGGAGADPCCDASDPCGYTDDSICDCPEQPWDALDCGSGPAVQCGPTQAACGTGCMPADAVCCDTGYCPPETTCGPDETCTTGGGGDVTLQEFCNLAVNGLCTCFDGTAAACTTAEAQGMYEACVAEDPSADFVLCFGAFVDLEAGTVRCRDASETCLTGP